MKPTGDSRGIKKIYLTQLSNLYNTKYPRSVACSAEQAQELVHIAFTMQRNLSIIIDKKGNVVDVIIGTRTQTLTPNIEVPTNNSKLQGLRIIHIHITEELFTTKEYMDLLFLRLNAITVITMNSKGTVAKLQYAYLHSLTEQPPYYISDAIPSSSIDTIHFPDLIELEKYFIAPEVSTTHAQNRAILISIDSVPKEIQIQNLEELQSITETAGLKTVATMIQRTANKKKILSKEKLLELEYLALQYSASILIFDGELSPTELDTLTRNTTLPVLDRTQVILDIFAKNAHSQEGKLQVEIAKLYYMQPRLIGQASGLDRLAGGIGGRGAGETKLELDKRKIASKIHKLQHELASISKRRTRHREQRLETALPIIALVGYTNTGKSSLLNMLTNSTVLVENKLFATLESTTRKVYISPTQEALLTDTIGFIRNLPQELKQAFISTLEELYVAKLLIHVADANSMYLENQINAVEEIIDELQLETNTQILVLNKCELLTTERREELSAIYPHAIFLSTKTKEGKAELLASITQALIFEQEITLF